MNQRFFLVLDELDAFCMSRNRTQEHDAIRRAMTTLMLELDKFKPSTTQKFLIFGITNVPELIDTAVVRRFSVKRSVEAKFSLELFENFINYLNKPMQYTTSREKAEKLFSIYHQRLLTPGDIKSIYKNLFLDSFNNNFSKDDLDKKIVDLFEKEFSTGEHLQKSKELAS